MTLRALVIDSIHSSGFELLSEFGHVDTKLNIDPIHLSEIVADYDILIGRSTPVTPRIERPILDKSGRLKVIGIASVGLDRVATDYVKSRGIHLAHLPGINSISVAEHAFAMLLSSRRYVLSAYEQMKHGNWNKHGYLDAMDIHENVIGIIGLGNIGTETAHIAKNGFRMNVLAYDPYVSSEICLKKGVEKVSLNVLLRESDIVVIHAPLTQETYHMIGSEEIRKMKNGSVLLNLARGGIIDEEALYDGLVNGPLKFAGLDVQEHEPMTSSPLFSLPNFLATPHIAGLTQNYFNKAGLEIVTKCLKAIGIKDEEINKKMRWIFDL